VRQVQPPEREGGGRVIEGSGVSASLAMGAEANVAARRAREKTSNGSPLT